MNKQEIKCYQIPIKSSKQISQLKKREQNPIQGTPKIVLGKFLNDTQQIWTEEYKCQKISSLRQLRSNDLAFEIAILILTATKQLIKIYGNFLLNENMVFATMSKKIFIWISPDIFCSSPKIYLPQNKQGEISMIKGLINYFKLWLQTQYSLLNEIQTLEEFTLKIHQFKKQKPPTLSKVISLAEFSKYSSQNSGENLRLYESTKGIVLKKLPQEESYSKQNSNNSDSNSTKEKCMTNRCFTSQLFQNKYSKKLLTNDKCEKSQVSNVQSGSQGQKGSFSNSFSKQATKSFRSIKKKDDEPKFAHKTASSTLQIIQKIQQQDDNPDSYTVNKILIQDDVQKQKTQEEKKKIKSSLVGINQELDNLFLSNIDSEQNQETVVQREKQFEEILDL